MVIVVPMVVLGLPIFDTLFAIVRRLRKGNSIMVADRGHLHHKLMDVGFSQKQAVILLYSASAFLGVMAVVLMDVDVNLWGFLIFAILFLVIGIFAVTNVMKNKKELLGETCPIHEENLIKMELTLSYEITKEEIAKLLRNLKQSNNINVIKFRTLVDEEKKVKIINLEEVEDYIQTAEEILDSLK